MNFLLKGLITMLTLLGTVVGTVVGIVEWNDSRTDKKLVQTESRLRQHISEWEEKTREHVAAGDALLATRIVGVEKTMNSIDKNVRVLLRMELKKAVQIENSEYGVYTSDRVTDKKERKI